MFSYASIIDTQQIHRGKKCRYFCSRSHKKIFFHFSSPKAKDLVEVLTEAKQVVNPKLTEMVMCGGFNRNANKGRYGGSFGGRGRGGK